MKTIATITETIKLTHLKLTSNLKALKSFAGGQRCFFMRPAVQQYSTKSNGQALPLTSANLHSLIFCPDLYLNRNFF